MAGWQVGSVAEARQAVDAGCDLVIAQGMEAGGHVRGAVGLLPLLAEVLEADRQRVAADPAMVRGDPQQSDDRPY